MTTTCATCSSALDEGTPVCPNCGTAVAASPGVVETAPSTAPIFKSFEDRNDLNGIGGWLILPAIGLAIAPFFALYGIFVTDLPMLTGSRYQIFLTGHPGIFGLLIFEIIVNALFLAGSLGLNFLFYKKHRLFPSYMIAYLVTQFFLLLADHLGTVALLPSVDNSSGAIGAFRAFVGAAIWIPYFLNSQRVKVTFVN